MTTKTELFLATRTDALRRGDRGVYKAMTAELAHLGYTEPSPVASSGEFPALDASATSQVNRMLETTQAPAMDEAAVPPAPRRPGRPRKIVD